MNGKLARGCSGGRLMYRWDCAGDRCGISQSQTLYLAPGEEFADPSIPEGWRELHGRFYCPLHDVLIIVDERIQVLL